MSLRWQPQSTLQARSQSFRWMAAARCRCLALSCPSLWGACTVKVRQAATSSPSSTSSPPTRSQSLHLRMTVARERAPLPVLAEHAAVLLHGRLLDLLLVDELAQHRRLADPDAFAGAGLEPSRRKRSATEQADEGASAHRRRDVHATARRARQKRRLRHRRRPVPDRLRAGESACAGGTTGSAPAGRRRSRR